jgi:hypothetical protein
MSDFVLTAENYYSSEADMRYMSAHQYLDFVGHMGVHGCEARAMAKLNGEWVEETTKAMLVGSFVDAYFEGTLDQFLDKNKECFLKSNPSELRSEFRKAKKMIERCKSSSYFMKTLSGQKQVIMTGYLFGAEWKIKIDSYIPDVAIVDLKTSATIDKSWKVLDYGYVGFTEYWGYTIQLAIYQKIVEINTGKKLPCYCPTVTKERIPNIEVVNITQTELDHALNEVEMNMPSILAVKNGEIPPIRCEKPWCDYCKSTKVLTGPVSIYDLIMGE